MLQALSNDELELFAQLRVDNIVQQLFVLSHPQLTASVLAAFIIGDSISLNTQRNKAKFYQRLVNSPVLDTQTIEFLFDKYPKPYLLNSRYISLKVFTQVLSNQDKYDGLFVSNALNNPKCPSELLQANIEAHAAVVLTNPNFPVKLLAQYSKHYLSSVLDNPACPHQIIRRAFKNCGKYNVRNHNHLTEIILSANCPPDILEQVATDPDYAEFKYYGLDNPNYPTKYLRQAFAETKEANLGVIVTNPCCPLDLLFDAATDRQHAYAAVKICQNPQSNAKILLASAMSSQVSFVWACLHPNAPKYLRQIKPVFN